MEIQERNKWNSLEQNESTSCVDLLLSYTHTVQLETAIQWVTTHSISPFTVVIIRTIKFSRRKLVFSTRRFYSFSFATLSRLVSSRLPRLTGSSEKWNLCHMLFQLPIHFTAYTKRILHTMLYEQYSVVGTVLFPSIYHVVQHCMTHTQKIKSDNFTTPIICWAITHTIHNL